MDEIARLRDRIDEIDQNILDLLKNRYENARELGQLKQARAQKIRDVKREKAVLQRVQRSARKLQLNTRLTRRIFSEIFKLTIQAQSAPSISSKLLSGKNVLVIGGTGGMGRFFASFARGNGATVRIVGRDARKTQRVARELSVDPGSTSDAATSDVVIVSVPVQITKRIALEAASYMNLGSLLTDLASVKTGIADEISTQLPRQLEYVSLHPLFGPDTGSLSKQNLAAVIYRAGPQWRVLSRAIRSSGGRIRLVASSTHDKTMALVQVLHHFALICLASSLADWDGYLATNSIRATLARIRPLLKNWDTVLGIQRINPYAKNTRKEYARTVSALVDLAPVSWKMRRSLSSYVLKWSRKL